MTDNLNREPICRCCGKTVTLDELGVGGKDDRMVHWTCYKRGHGAWCKHKVGPSPTIGA